MVYVISDIHGCYEEFMQMLELIKFSDKDILYVLGDCIDRGSKPLDVLTHCLLADNIKLLCGNHEWFLYENSDYICDKFETDPIALTNERVYLSLWLDYNGGDTTVKQYKNLSYIDKQFILQSIAKLPLYFNIDVDGKKYVMLHGGFGGSFVEDKKLSKYRRDTLLWERLDPNRTYYKDKHIIVGHTPTVHYGKEHEGHIFKSHGNYWVDCGCTFGYNLGCLCLNTLEEFYVEKKKPMSSM